MTERDLDRVQFVTRHFHSLQGLRHWVPLGLILLSLGGHTYFENRAFILLRVALFTAGLFLALAAPRYYRSSFGRVDPQPLLGRLERETESLSIYAPSGLSPASFKPSTLAAPRRWTLALGAALGLYLLLRALSPSFGFVADESLVEAPWSSFSGAVVWHTGLPAGAGDSPTMVKAFYGQLLYSACGVLFLGLWVARGWRLSQGYFLGLGLLFTALSSAGASLGSLRWWEGGSPWFAHLLLPALVQLWLAAALCGGALILGGLLDHALLARVLGRSSSRRAEEAR